MIPPYFLTERLRLRFFKSIGTQPQENPLFSRRQAQSICFSPQEQKIIGKTLIFLKQAVFLDYFEV